MNSHPPTLEDSAQPQVILPAPGGKVGRSCGYSHSMLWCISSGTAGCCGVYWYQVQVHVLKRAYLVSKLAYQNMPDPSRVHANR